jgi:hypothetical protein
VGIEGAGSVNIYPRVPDTVVLCWRYLGSRLDEIGLY